MFQQTMKTALLLAFSVSISAAVSERAYANHHARGFHDGQTRHREAALVQRAEHANHQNKVFEQANTNFLVNESLHNRTQQFLESGRLVRFKNGIDIDLASESRNITLGSKLFSDAQSISIVVDGQQKTVSAGSQVTAAEYVAAKQVLSGLHQDLVIDSSGRAVSGSVDLDAITSKHDSMRASNLTVPVEVTARGDFSRGSEFRLLGDLVNSGTVFATTTDDKIRSGAIHAANVQNNAGALISSVGGANPIDLTVAADSDLVNFGTIESSGSLTLSAGHSIRNTSTIKADGNVNLVAPQIANSGSVQTNANINIDAPTLSTLQVANDGGTLSALNGSISIRNAQYNDAFDTSITGGDLLSHDVNFNAGQGVFTANVNQLTGTVNQTGNAAHITAATDVLNIGKVCLTGDPTFFNTAGLVFIAGDISVTESLTIIARGAITSADNVTITTATIGGGFPVTLIAGANITGTTGGANQGSIGPIPPANNNNGSVTIDGTVSTTGGSILLGNGVVINTSPSAGIGIADGGNVLMAAFSQSNVDGKIDLSGTTITTGGRGFTAQNGNVTIIAGNNAAGSIQVGTIGTTGGNNLAGNVTIQGAQPTSSAGPLTFAANGSGPQTSIVASNAVAPNSTINLVGPIDSAGDVVLDCDGSITSNIIGTATVTANAESITMTSHSGSIVLASNTNSAIANLTAHLELNTRNSTRVTAATMTLVSEIGNIQNFNPGGFFNLDATNLNANCLANNRSIIVSDSNSLNIGIGDTQSNATVITLASGGTLTIAGATTQTTPPAILNVTANNITISQNLATSTSLTLNAGGALSTTGSNAVSSPTISLTGDTIGSASQRFTVANGGTATLSVAPTTDLFINSLGGFTLNANATVTNTFDVLSDGNISTPVTIQGQTVSLHADGDIFNGGVGVGNIFSNQTILVSDNGDIADNAGLGFFATQTNNLEVHAPAGNAVVRNTTNLVLAGGSDASNLLSIRANRINTSGTSPITGFNVVLVGDTTSLNLGVNVTAANVLTLASTGANNITTSNGAVLTAPTIAMGAGTGTIGVDVNNRLNTNADKILFGTTAGNTPTGVFISEADTLTIGQGASNTFNGTFDVVSNGSLTLDQNITAAGGNVNLTAKTGVLTINATRSITSDRGVNLILVGAEKKAKKTDFINFGAGSNIITNAATPGLGNILISIGKTKKPKDGKPPKLNVIANETGTGQIFFGKGITADVAPDNVLTAKNANININNSFKKTSITLGGGVIITADPPATEN